MFVAIIINSFDLYSTNFFQDEYKRQSSIRKSVTLCNVTLRTLFV